QATHDELKASYRRLCMLYHPDKHRDPELKSQAELLFNLVHQAYTDTAILSGSLSTQNGNGGGTINVAIRRVTSTKGWGEAPLTTTDTAILSGSLSTQNGNGGGTINVAIRRLELGAGDMHGPLFGMKIFRNLTPRWSVPVVHLVLMTGFLTTQCALQVSSRGVRPGLTTVLARHLDKNTMGYLQWRWGTQSAMNTSIVRDTKTSHLTFALQVRGEEREGREERGERWERRGRRGGEWGETGDSRCIAVSSIPGFIRSLIRHT
ncbi:UNVERIFIED_CONTAM: hypothetical protein FKN15_065776, partial [Acipenser sinensis]